MTREEEELFEPGAGNVPKTADLSNADAIQHQQEPDAAPTVSSMPEESSSASASPDPEGQMQLFDEQFLTPEAEKSHRIIGQVFKIPVSPRDHRFSDKAVDRHQRAFRVNLDQLPRDVAAVNIIDQFF